MHAPTREQLAELPRLIALVGPTGVGKTALALELAEALGAEIVGMDSVQIYEELDIGSAKPTPAERARVPHHLVDELSPDRAHNVGDYEEAAREAIAEIHARGKAAMVVGGTGLYLRVLVHGLFEAPPPDEAIRARHRERAAREGREALHAELAEVDEELAARVHPNDLVRISRGLEIWEQTGRPLSQLQREHRFQVPNYHALKLALVRPRPELYARIDARVERMLEGGLIEEVRGLLERYPAELRVFGSVGYRQVVAHLTEGVEREETIRQIKRATRRYAKQQLSWLRSEPGVQWARAPLLAEGGQLPAQVYEGCARFLATGQLEEMAWAEADPYM